MSGWCREFRTEEEPSTTRHFVVLSKVWFFILKYLVFEAYPLLAPKCRVGAGRRQSADAVSPTVRSEIISNSLK